MDLKKLHPLLADALNKIHSPKNGEGLLEGMTKQQAATLVSEINAGYVELQHRLHGAQVQFERLKVIVDSTPCTISWINDRLEYEGINETLLRLTGQSPDEFLGKPIGFQSEDNYFYMFAKQLFESKDQTLQKELASTIGGVTKHFWVVGSKYSVGKGAVIIGVETTDLKRTQMELKKVEKLVDIDDLTGLYNMRSMYDKLESELARGRRFDHATAVVMMDMDHFKKVNDNNDHLFGSFVLTEIGRMVKTLIREVDHAARYGGDEFMFILPQTHQKGAETFCERLRTAIAAKTFQNEHYSTQLTASFGFSLCNSGAKNLTSKVLMRVADFALYGAKRSGRNRVCAITQATEPEKFNPDYKLNY